MVLTHIFSTTHPSSAVDDIEHKHFVDDYLQSFENTSEAIQVVKDVILINTQAGFIKRNFFSNSAEVLNELKEPLIQGNKKLTYIETPVKKVF